LAACLFSGVLIDIDHYLDYYLFHRKLPADFEDMRLYCANVRRGKLYLFLHAWESILILWFFIHLLGLGEMWIGLALGLTLHVLGDNLVNPLKPFAYFFTYRVLHRFARAKLLVRNSIQRNTHEKNFLVHSFYFMPTFHRSHASD